MTASTDSARALVDTNILVYAYDLDDPVKHGVAQALIEQLSIQGRLLFSVQVCNEFCSVMMRPNRTTRYSPTELTDVLSELAAIGDVVPISARTTLRALAAMPKHGLSFWDALIWAAAAENGAAMIYTEDFQDGRDVDGVRFVNPFLIPQSPAS
jgi:predicted nucleic acid-binding protein